jgi:signal transduction histidine kinase
MADYLMTDTDIKDLIPIYQAQYRRGVVPYYLLNIDNRIIDCNNALIKLLRCTHQDVVGKTLTELGVRYVDSSELNKTPRVFKEDDGITIRRTIMISTDRQRIVATSAQKVILSSTKKIIGYVCRLNIHIKSEDSQQNLPQIIDDEQPTEPALPIGNDGGVSTESTNSHFNSELLHDLKNALANLNILMYLVQQNITPQGEKYGDRLESQIQRIQDMILTADVQEKEVMPKHDAQNLHEVLRDIISVNIDQAKVKHIDVVYINSANDLSIDLTRNDLYRLFSNLISNAIKYTKIGEVIVVVRFDNSTSMVEVQISDTGIGIPYEDQANIFEPNFRSRHAVNQNIKGSGIGLSIVKHMVTKAGGTLRVDSQLNIGTTITVDLPCYNK